MAEYRQTIMQIRKRGALNLTDEEVEILESAPQSYGPAHRMLCAHYFNIKDNDRAIEKARLVYALTGKPGDASNLVSAVFQAKRYAEALEVVKSEWDVLKPLARANYRAELHGLLGHETENRYWISKVMEMKDAEAPVLENRPDPVVHRFDMTTPARNIISYSLYGDNPHYLDGAIRNAIVVRHLYPGWTARFYIDETVPEPALKRLREEGAQLRSVPSLAAGRFGLYWRFLVEDDPEVDIYLVRDADSVPNIKERIAVQGWLKSGEPFHVMRDQPTHSELVLAGMWGAHRGNIRGMGQKILDFAETQKDVLNSRVYDQVFLRRVIWPLMRGRVFLQDGSNGYGATGVYDPTYVLPKRMHIGQDDVTMRAHQANARSRRASKTKG